MDAKKRVLFFVYQRTVFVDAYRTATQLRNKTEFVPVFLVAAGTAALVQDDIERCRRDGIACFTEEQLSPHQPRRLEKLRTFGNRCFLFAKYRSLWLFMHCWRIATWVVPRHVILSAARWVAKRLVVTAQESEGRLPGPIERFLGISVELNRLRAIKVRYASALKALQPHILCMSEDMPGSFTAPLIQAARDLGIPSVIIPFTIPNAREAIEACYGESTKDLWLNDYVADHIAMRMYPRWAVTYKDRTLLRARGRLIAACERFGIAPVHPWILNSGFADRIAVESEQMLTIYQNAGFPPKQLSLTGSASDDMLFEARQQHDKNKTVLYDELGLRKDLPLLLTSLVPNQLSGGVPFCEFNRYDILLEFWVGALTRWKHRYNVVLKVNPRTPSQDFLYLEKLGAKVAFDDTIRLMPFAEIYVASISSTLRWATACGIPCVNYDAYHYRYGDYLSATGMIHVETKEEFTAAIDRLAGDDAYRHTMRQRQMSQAKSWGQIDGQSTTRLVELFDELCSEQRAQPRVSERRLSA